MANRRIRPLTQADAGWVKQFMIAHWGSEVMITHNAEHQLTRLPGFAAFEEDACAGLITYHLNGEACEITSLDSLIEGAGIGSALIEAVKAAARQAGCNRLWLITTNDNLRALGFYQKRGFKLKAVYPDAVTAARLKKPEIPLIGLNGLPLRDEIELDLLLNDPTG